MDVEIRNQDLRMRCPRRRVPGIEQRSCENRDGEDRGRDDTATAHANSPTIRGQSDTAKTT